MKRAKITIIGAGNVGATVAYSIMHKGLAGEILFVDIAKEKAEGEAMDLAHCADFCPPAFVRSGEYADAVGSDIVIVASGAARKPGQTRLDLAKINVGIMRDIMPRITAVAPDAIYVIISNPVDVLTYAWARHSGVPPGRVMGSGTMLDGSRLKEAIASDLGGDPRDIDAWVLGEHGDSSFVPWSLAKVAGMGVEGRYGEAGVAFDADALLEKVRKGGAEVIKRKGSTFYAVAMSVAALVERLVEGAGSYVTVSSLVEVGDVGEVCLSLPTKVGSDGVMGVTFPSMEPEEMAKLVDSAKAIREVIDSTGLDE